MNTLPLNTLAISIESLVYVTAVGTAYQEDRNKDDNALPKPEVFKKHLLMAIEYVGGIEKDLDNSVSGIDYSFLKSIGGISYVPDTWPASLLDYISLVLAPQEYWKDLTTDYKKYISAVLQKAIQQIATAYDVDVDLVMTMYADQLNAYKVKVLGFLANQHKVN